MPTPPGPYNPLSQDSIDEVELFMRYRALEEYGVDNPP